jgi:hypothetical protein
MLVTSVHLNLLELGHRTVTTGVVKVNTVPRDLTKEMTAFPGNTNLTLFKELVMNAQPVTGVTDLLVHQVL